MHTCCEIPSKVLSALWRHDDNPHLAVCWKSVKQLRPSSVTRTSLFIYFLFADDIFHGFPQSLLENSGCSRVRLKRDGTRWHTGGEVKGRLATGVGSQYPSHYLGTWCIQSYYRWFDAHTSATSSRLNRRPCRFKWTCSFRRKTKSGFCACAITFQTQSTWIKPRPLPSWSLPNHSSLIIPPFVA